MATAAEKKAAQLEADKAAKLEADKAAQLEADKAQAGELNKQPSNGLIGLKFHAPYKAWSNGDIAGFTEKKAIEILGLNPSPAELYEKQ